MKIHEDVWDIFVLNKNHGHTLYSKHIIASHICPPKRIYCSNRENENRVFRDKTDFYLQLHIKVTILMKTYNDPTVITVMLP